MKYSKQKLTDHAVTQGNINTSLRRQANKNSALIDKQIRVYLNMNGIVASHAKALPELAKHIDRMNDKHDRHIADLQARIESLESRMDDIDGPVIMRTDLTHAQLQERVKFLQECHNNQYDTIAEQVKELTQADETIKTLHCKLDIAEDNKATCLKAYQSSNATISDMQMTLTELRAVLDDGPEV